MRKSTPQGSPGPPFRFALGFGQVLGVAVAAAIAAHATVGHAQEPVLCYSLDGRFGIQNDSATAINIGAVNLASANGVLVPGGASPFGIAVSDTAHSIAVATLGSSVRVDAGEVLYLSARWDTRRSGDWDVVGDLTWPGSGDRGNRGLVQCVPEPASGWLALSGFVAIGACRRRNRRSGSQSSARSGTSAGFAYGSALA